MEGPIDLVLIQLAALCVFMHLENTNCIFKFKKNQVSFCKKYYSAKVTS